ncbi:hypothetical protein JMJ35_010282 [Cladonia borealis]|uniref:Uncharacterized protein n=1 Tax=Cladonia borealis TaxID=184061 RepID=A0AA39QST0_9LECA|nr:hypothetical protein JMJ35_010282 [Cladonia borealis]
MGLPSPHSLPLPSHKFTPIPTLYSNGTIAISVQAAAKSTYPTLMIASPSYATASSSPTPASKSQNQSGWSPGDVGTILFGCIGTVLAVMTLWLTFWLGRQRFRFITNEEFRKQLQLENLL